MVAKASQVASGDAQSVLVDRYVAQRHAIALIAVASTFLPLQLYTYNQRHKREISTKKGPSSLLSDQAMPVVTYSIGQITPKTHFGGLNGTPAPAEERSLQLALVYMEVHVISVPVSTNLKKSNISVLLYKQKK